MGLILGLLDGLLCVILYVRMCRREVPEPMGKKAAIPVALGLVPPILSTLMLVCFGLIAALVTGTQGQLQINLPLGYTLRSLLAAFIGASFPEELTKFLFILLSVKLVKPRNIYEYGLLGAGIGTGFTFLEQMLYGSGNPVNALIRLPFFAMHVVFNLIMALFLGLAQYEKKNERRGAGKYAVLAFVVPLLWHTVFDAATTYNKMLQTGLETEDVLLRNVGAAIALIVIIASVALQVWELVRYKRRTEELCAMETLPQSSRPRHRKSER